MNSHCAPSRAFEPYVRRVTSIVLVRLKQLEQYYLVTSLATRNDTQLLKINPCGGALVFVNQRSIDVFADEGEAFDFLSNFDEYELIERGCGLLGYVPIGNVGLVLLATRIRTAVTLPGGHFVKLVTESKWLQVPLKLDGEYGKRLQGEEFANLQLLLKYTLNNAHYYCETADITRPFPSKYPVSQPSWEFVWNRYLAAALRDVNLPDHCPPLLQGVVEAKSLEDFSGNKYTFCLFSRRSRLHPGMRYIARGLNILASPGNEIECEQAVWTCPTNEGGPLKWSNYVWRRGTVPIWWGVELRQGGVGEADVVIPTHRPYKGTARYFRRLQKRYMPDMALETAMKQARDEAVDGQGYVVWPEELTMDDPTRLVPIICINLLRCNMQKKNELCLSEHFAESIRQLRRKIPEAPVRVVNFDWHGNMKELKEKGTVEGLWAQLEQVMTSIDVHAGMMEPQTEANKNDPCTTPWPGQRMRWVCQQKGAIRYNCADSLDRTNAASYFGAIQTLAEQCRRLGISVEVSKGAGKLAMRKIRTKATPERSPSGELGGTPQVQRLVKGQVAGRYPGTVSVDKAGPLPQGWEARVDELTGKTFYLDHNTRKTTWTRPPPPAATQMTSMASPDSSQRLASSGSTPDLRPSNSSGSLGSAMSVPTSTSDRELENGSADAEGRWGLFGCTVDEVRNKLLPDCVAEHAEVFLINGDMQSNLYTASRAMHSHVINLLQGDSGAVMRSGVGKLANLSVAVQRRWSNMLTDATRQQILEMFLGLKPDLYFPTIRTMYVGDLPLEDESDGDDDSDDEGMVSRSPGSRDIFGEEEDLDSNQEILEFAIGQPSEGDLLGLGAASSKGSAGQQAKAPQDLLSDDLLQLGLDSVAPTQNNTDVRRQEPTTGPQFDSLI